MGYTKLFSSIVASTIWREDDKVRIVWITMLAMKNERHEVEASVPGLADMARVTIEDCEKAIEKLSSPDKFSRNQENKGRRIEPCDGGWKILNGEYYRQKMSLDERRDYQRLYMKDYRKRRKQLGAEAGCAGAQRAIKEGFEDVAAVPAGDVPDEARHWIGRGGEGREL
jgi:hypothetical protein